MKIPQTQKELIESFGNKTLNKLNSDLYILDEQGNYVDVAFSRFEVALTDFAEHVAKEQKQIAVSVLKDYDKEFGIYGDVGEISNRILSAPSPITKE